MKYSKLIVSAIVGCALLTSCAQTTKSMFGDDRNQFMLVSEDTINAQSAQEYYKVIADEKTAANGSGKLTPLEIIQ